MSFTSLTWNSDGDFGSIPTEINGGGNYHLVTDGSSTGTRRISTALKVSSDGSYVSASVFFDGIDDSTADINNAATDGNTSTATGYSDIGSKVTVSGEVRTDDDGYSTVYVEDNVVGGGYGPDGEDFFGGGEYAPYYTSGTLNGNTKSFADVFIYENVTVSGTTTSDSSFSVTVSNNNGDTQSLTGTGTTDLSIGPSKSASVSVVLDSTGHDTAKLDYVRVRAQPAVQVYTNGSWEYKPLSIFDTNGSEIIPSVVQHYDGSSGSWQ
jgi:hypothetical protein